MIYGSFLQLKQLLASEDNWFLLGCVRSSTAHTVQANMSQIMALVLQQFFCKEIAQPRLGLLLKHESGESCQNIRLFFKFGMFLADGSAMKYIYSCKGDSGSKFCVMCRNVRAPLQEELEDENDMLGSDVCTLSQCQLATNQEVLQAYQRCAANQTAMSKRAFDDWQQACGVTHNQHSLFLCKQLLDQNVLQPISQWCHDWMHAMASQGVMQVMIYLLCATLGWESMETYLKLWTLPATWQKAGSLPELFSSKKVKSYKEAKKFKCSASETLSLCPLLAFLAAHVFVPKGSHVLECQAFLSMNRVLELLQASDRVAPPVLQKQVEFALRKTKEAGWSNYMTRKFHWLLHLATSLQLHGVLPSCWSLERKHKVCSRYATATTNLSVYEQSILEEVLAHDLHSLKHSAVFQQWQQGACLTKPRAANKKLALRIRMTLGMGMPDDCIHVGNQAKLRTGASCQAKDVVLMAGSQQGQASHLPTFPSGQYCVQYCFSLYSCGILCKDLLSLGQRNR